MVDKFESFSTNGMDSPGNDHFLITPDDDNDLAIRPRFLRVGGVGSLVVVMNGVAITYENVSGVFPVRPHRIMATGTTATNIVGEY